MSDRRLAQQQRKGTLQLDVLTESGIHAMVPGEGDLALGVEWLQARAAAVAAPYTAANLVCGGERPFAEHRSVEVVGLELQVVGLVSPTAQLPRGCQALPPGAALASVLDREGTGDLVVVLSRLTPDEDRDLAEAEPRIDLIVGGGSQTARSAPQGLAHDTARLEVGSRGKKLVVAQVHWVPGASGFRVASSVEDLEGQLRRMQKRRDSAVAHRDRTTDARSKERQERRIAHYDEEIPKLEAQLAQAQAVQTGPAHTLDLALRSLDAGVADHPPTAERVAAAKADIEAMEASAATPAPLRGPFVGSGACAGCHPAQTTQWQSTAHAHAWQTLIDQRRHMDLDCYACHATGAFHPEGPSHPNQVGQLAHVGCEACHGPGRDHVRDPQTGSMVADPPEATCTQCHDGEQDEGRFSFDTYRPQVVHASSP